MSLETSSNKSIVNIYDYDYVSAHHCGYCNSNGSISHGMTAQVLQITDYQDLIDRGWRRSGTYLYKPIMNETCCPLYSIRCDALNFELKNSQKKVLKIMKNYLEKNIKVEAKKSSKIEAEESLSESKTCSNKIRSRLSIPTKADRIKLAFMDKNSNEITLENINLKLKSKQKRLFKKLKKLNVTNAEDIEKCLKRRNRNNKITLEDRITIKEPSKNKLEIKLIRSWPPSIEFVNSLNEEHSIYAKYQMAIHNDSAMECNMEQFKRFLCSSPFDSSKYSNGTLDIGYGSFHQQYRINDKLIAVGVIDILNNCVSSVYFFYDPDYCFLNLGTYSALNEIALVRTLNKQDPNIKWYYLGYYVHSCKKMKYKGQYFPSYLLCPEVFSWHPIEDCLPLICASKYTRLNANKQEKDNEKDEQIDNILIQIRLNGSMKILKFTELIQFINSGYITRFKNQIKGYCGLFGKKVANRIIIKF